jgi:thiol-disulfide isomerase/thioredoxin
MTMYLNRPIAYLEDDDFDADGSLVNPEIPDDLPVVVMLQANFCGYCTTAKTAFQEFANANEGKVFCATIQGDGKIGREKALGDRLRKVKSNFRGFPDYALFVAGSRVPKEIGGRSLADLEKFAVFPK